VEKKCFELRCSILADEREEPMEMQKVSLKDIKTDPLAHELATSEAAQPHLDCAIKAYCDHAVAFESALEVVRNLPSKSDTHGKYFPR
jgi:hypothetical protein